MVRKLLLPALLVLAVFMLAGCGDYGKVDQGVVVAFDKEKSTVLIVPDTNTELSKPGKYNILPVREYKLPEDPLERGADPSPGLRTSIDIEGKTITMYNPEKKAFDVIPILEVVEDNRNVDVRRRHKQVWEINPATGRGAPKKFPIINREKQTIELYAIDLKRHTIIRLAEEDKERYKEDWMWNSGCEVRMYYREPGKSLRFMNITKTDITRR
jgi:hypothetical protein